MYFIVGNGENGETENNIKASEIVILALLFSRMKGFSFIGSPVQIEYCRDLSISIGMTPAVATIIVLPPVTFPLFEI